MIEIKLQFNTIAEVVAFLTAAGPFNPVVSEPKTLAQHIEESKLLTPAEKDAAPKKGPGRPPKAQAPTQEPSASEQSAPPAAEPSVAETPAAASPAAEPVKPQAYAESDVPGRIMKLVEVSKTSGDKSKIELLKALLATYGVKSAKDLTVEQFADFRPRFDALESNPTEEVLG